MPNIISFDPQHCQGASADLTSSGTSDFPRFYSILFAASADRIGDDALGAPGFFGDLNCDQIVDAIAAGKEDYNLKPFFLLCQSAACRSNSISP